MNSHTWPLSTIDEIKAGKKYAISMGPFGSNITTDNFVQFGIPVIRGLNLAGNKFQEKDFVYLTNDKADKLISSNAVPGDIIFTHRGTLGQVAIIPYNANFQRYVVSQSQMKLSCNVMKSDPFFVYYYFISSKGQRELLLNTSTTGVPALAQPLTSLKQLTIPLPKLNIQKKIVNILKTLDDIIDNLKESNTILEKTIQSIFKSWFIDFDGQTEFMDSELGPIPKGWSVKTIDNLADITSGKRPEQISKIKSTEMNIPLYGSGGIMGYVSTPYFKKPIIITGRVGTIGILHLVDEPCFPSDNTIVIIPNHEEYLFLLLHQLKQIDFNSFISGSTQPLITQTNIKNEVIVLPESDILDKFHKFAKNVFSIISKNNYKINTLNNIRDSLLPKLMSGEIQV